KAIAAAPSPQDAAEAIRPRFAELLADQAWLPDELAAPVPGSGMGGGIRQWLLSRAADESLSLFALVVPSCSSTPVHDHLAWGLVGLYRGEQDEEIYAREGDELRLLERRARPTGHFFAPLPPARPPRLGPRRPVPRRAGRGDLRPRGRRAAARRAARAPDRRLLRALPA